MNFWFGDDGKLGWEFDVVVIIGDGEELDGGQFYLYYDYFKEGVGNMGVVMLFGLDELVVIGMIYMKVDDLECVLVIIDMIDIQFVNLFVEIKMLIEKVWVQGFVNQVGDLVLIVMVIVSVVFFMLLLVVGNIMVQLVCECILEFGVFKMLGFSDGLVMFLVLGEVFFLVLFGGFLGLFFVNVIILQLKLGVGFILDIYILLCDLMIGVVFVFVFGFVIGVLFVWWVL